MRRFITPTERPPGPVDKTQAEVERRREVRRTLIDRLRHQGYTETQIAAHFGLHRNTLKTFNDKHHMGREQWNAENMTPIKSNHRPTHKDKDKDKVEARRRRLVELVAAFETAANAWHVKGSQPVEDRAELERDYLETKRDLIKFAAQPPQK